MSQQYQRYEFMADQTGEPIYNAGHPGYLHQGLPSYSQAQPDYSEGHHEYRGYLDNHSSPIGGAARRDMTWDKEDVDDLEDTRGSFGSKAIRLAFIRKVFLILFYQLLTTFVVVCIFRFHKDTQQWVQNHQAAYFVSYGVFVVTYMALVCCSSLRRSFPGNFIALAVFTLAFSYVTGAITSMYNTEVILIAAGITTAVCLALTFFAWQTKIDFTLCSGLIFVVSLILLLFGIVVMIVSLISGPSKVLMVVYGAIGALVFSLYLVYDVQMLIGNKEHSLSEEEYIYGALQLYMDIINLFLLILSLVGAVEK